MSTWEVPGYTESTELGAGASGRVVLAVHEETGVAVAVKYLSESLRTRPGFVHGFREEARLLAGLESPYVTGLYEYVESPQGAAIVMELVDGVSLRTLLSRNGPLEPEAALVILKGSLLGLADAHAVGVVHRDYKPENVLVVPDGSSKLVDFGIAVDSGTSAGVAGTPSYMAPEQWSGAPASPAADVYAATATFFECLTGRKPYSGDNFAELALQHLEAPIPAEEAPEAVRELVRRGLAKEPERRPAQAAQFVTELESVAGSAYGHDWEERGRGRLAALVALVPLLLPSARGGPQSTTDLARTVLRQPPAEPLGLDPVPARSWVPGRPGILVSVSAVVLGLLLTYGVPFASGNTGGDSAQAAATSSAGPGADPVAETTAPGSSADPSASPSASASPSESASESPSATESADDTDPTADTDPPAGGGTTTTPPGDTDPTPTTTAPTEPGAPAVKSVTVSGFSQTGGTTATATLNITTDGPGPVSVTVSWYSGNVSGQLGGIDGAPQTYTRSGATSYSITVDHSFQTLGCYWSVYATTDPAAAGGAATQQLLTKRCDIR
ncbi:serine/threonine-protein kinase [Streptomyces sp. GXMU-J15]|uniref:non-specific serine/threonine protein kinase n=1 Tax=Streptomyces fuscus TaxID=3048495 RepID=A0ABT7J288_9ACTN|nr:MULTISPECIES: serine/threonine-protein kinase [Streptomyces]MDL2078978.1 serine/threonine-protein kinase [Streptomyces fuscus]SBT92734.1 serine/threonine protein kinase [Streptomyces sp. DI166]